MAEQTVVSHEEEAALEDLRRLNDVQFREGVEAARALIKDLVAKQPESEAIQHKARVLEPPRVIGTGPATLHLWQKDIAWLREHAKEYPGCWLAVKDGRLMAADPDPRVVMAAVDVEGIVSPLVHLEPDPSQWS